MESKRIWVAKNHDIGYKYKSHMAEFSPNPDSRNKRDTSFKEYRKRLNSKENIRMENRIAINKLRNKQKLNPFLNQDEYEEIVEESELVGQDLINFLLQYNFDFSLDDNLKRFIPLKKNQNNRYKIFEKNNRLYIKLGSLSNLLKMDNQEVLEIMMALNDALINNNNLIYPNDNNIYKEIKEKKSIYFISYDLVLSYAYIYKKDNPKDILNQDLFILISEFEKNSKRLRIFTPFISFVSFGMFSSNLEEQYFKLFK